MPRHNNVYEAPKILGFLDKDGNRVILTDPTEVGNFILSGGTMCHRFSTMEGASIWQNHGEIKHCDLNMENTKQQKGREDHSLEQAAEPSAQETDFNATTIYFGVTTDDIRMIVRDLHEVEHHVQRGAKLHYSFPTMEGASFWEKHGIVRDHFFEAYSVDQNTVGLHQILKDGAEKTAQAYKKKEKSKYASLSRPKADSKGPTVYFGLKHSGDRACKFLLTDFHQIESQVKLGAILHYSFPTFEIALKWKRDKTGTFQDDNVVEYSAIPTTVDLHQFLMDGVEKTARIAASLPIPEPDLNVPTVYIGLRLLSGSRFILTDLNEVASYFMKGAGVSLLFPTEEVADYWKDHGTLRDDDIEFVYKFRFKNVMEFYKKTAERVHNWGDITTLFFGVTHWENFRMILSDPTEIRAYLEHGASIDGMFANMDAASYWLNNGVMKRTCFIHPVDPIVTTDRVVYMLKTAPRNKASNSLSETHFNATTIYFGLTSDDIRMIVRDLHEVEHHVQRGAKLHYSFPSTGRASFWEKHGIVRDHFFEAYSVDQNTVGLHQILKDGAEKTAQAYKKKEKSKYASLSRPKADSNGPTVYFGLTHWDDRANNKDFLTDLDDVKAYVNRGASLHYSFPTFEIAMKWFGDETGTFQDDNVVEYSAIPYTDLHEFLMDGVKKTAQIAASLPIPEPDLNVPTVYFGLKLLSGSRFILTDLDKVASFFMKGAEFPFLFQTKEAADYWKDHGTLRDDGIEFAYKLRYNNHVELCGSTFEDPGGGTPTSCFFGVTHWENFRMILSDHTEIRAYLEHGGSIDGVFANSDAASYWLNNGVMKDSWNESCTFWNPTTMSKFFGHVLKEASNALSETDFNASTTAIFGCVDEAGSQTVLNAQGESQELPNSLSETDFNATTIYFGLTSDDIRMIVRDLDVVEYHVQRGAKLHYSFPSTGRASFWEKHGIVRDHFFEAYSVDQNTVGLHQILKDGAEKTAQAYKKQEKSKYASLSRPKADSKGPTVYFGLTHWDDRANNKEFFTDLDEVEAHVNRGAILHYSFPTFEIGLKWIADETGTFQDDNVVEYSAIPTTVDLHQFLMDGVKRTARIAASLPIPEPDLNVPTVYFGLRLLSGSRFILTDLNEVASYFMKGAEIPFLFQTKEAADYWKDHGTSRKDDIVDEFPVATLVNLCGGDTPTSCFFGVTHWENFRMILSDHTEIRAYLEHGGSIDGAFANSDAASYWLNNGVMKDSWNESRRLYNPTTITEFFRILLKNFPERFRKQKNKKKFWKNSKKAAKFAAGLVLRAAIAALL